MLTGRARADKTSVGRRSDQIVEHEMRDEPIRELRRHAASTQTMQTRALTRRFGTGDAILLSSSLLVVELIDAWQREE